MDLLANYWNRQHYTGSVVYRPVFMRDMACNGPFFSKFLLNALLFAGVKYSLHPAGGNEDFDMRSAGRPFRRRIDEIIHGSGSKVLFESKITTIQALLVVAGALSAWCDESSLSWHYLGIATSMLVDLGLHAERGSSKGYLPEDVEVHRRVFWGAFGMVLQFRSHGRG